MIFISWAFAAINHRAVSKLLSTAPQAHLQDLRHFPSVPGAARPVTHACLARARAERRRRLPPSIWGGLLSIHSCGKHLLSICCFPSCTGLGAGHAGVDQAGVGFVLERLSHITFSIPLLPPSRRCLAGGGNSFLHSLSCPLPLKPTPPHLCPDG